MTALRELAERWKGDGCRNGSSHECADELIQILDAEGDGGAVSVPVAHFIETSPGNWEQAADMFRGQPGVKPLYTHPQPARSGGVSDEQVGLYYLQDTRQYVGNCPMWWAVDGKGYVTRLDEAHRYTFDQAMKQHRSRNTDVPWACAVIDALRRPTVDMQEMGSVADQIELLAAIKSQGESNV